MSLIGFSVLVQGPVLMVMENIIYRELSEVELEKQTCAKKGDMSHEMAKDYLPYTCFLTVYMTAFVIIYVFLFQPEMKRSTVDKLKAKKDDIPDKIVSTATVESEIFVN